MSFYLCEVDGQQCHFKTMPLFALRALVDACVSEMKEEFEDSSDLIDEWAFGDYGSRDKLRRQYSDAFDHPKRRIDALFAFDTIVSALIDREKAMLQAALSTRQAAA